MKKVLAALGLQCVAAALVVASGPSGAVVDYAQPANIPVAQPQRIACATPDQWTGAALTSIVTAQVGSDGSSIDLTNASSAENATTWNAEFRGKALGRTTGALRARIARQGGLWSANVRDVGISEARALLAFKRIHVWARATGGGRIIFRTWDGNVTASRVLAMAQGRRAPAVIAAVAPKGASIDTAFMRVEGRYSNDAVGFAQSLPYGIDFYPFGTAFVAKVPAALVSTMWDALDSEGGRAFLVGSSATMVAGRQVSDAAKHCGGTALLRRFPTPMVLAALPNGAVVDIEGQRVNVSTGDVLLTIQAPPQGRGFEVGIARFTR